MWGRALETSNSLLTHINVASKPHIRRSTRWSIRCSKACTNKCKQFQMHTTSKKTKNKNRQRLSSLHWQILLIGLPSTSRNWNQKIIYRHWLSFWTNRPENRKSIHRRLQIIMALFRSMRNIWMMLRDRLRSLWGLLWTVKKKVRWIELTIIPAIIWSLVGLIAPEISQEVEKEAPVT